MADNVILNSGSGGDTAAADDIGGIKHQRVKLSVGADGTAVDAIPIASGLDTTATGVQAVGVVGQFDDVATSSVTENQFAPIRISTRRALLVEGVASGTAIAISAASLPLPSDAATETTLSALAGDVGDAADAAAVAGGTGTLHAKQRLMTSQLDSIKTAVEIIDNFISGARGLVTEDNSAAIKTSVELIDDAIKADDAVFTPATTKVMMAGFEFDDVAPDSVDEGDAGAARMSARREVYTQIRDAAGNERGLNIDANGAIAVTQSGTWDEVGINDSGNSITVDNATLTVVGGGVEATALRVTIASDSTGVLSVDDNGGALTVDNGGTFAVQENGAALTALQLIDDVVFAEDVAAQAADKGIAILAVRRDADTTLVGADNDYANLQVNANGALKVEIFDGGDSHTIDGTVTANLSATDNAVLDVIASPVATISATPLQRVAIFDAADAQITSFGGGTQYTEDAAAAANPVGTAPILVRADTPAGVTSTDGDNIAQRATNYGAAYVQIVSSAGAFVDSFGGGTQYTEDVASAADPVGTQLIARRRDSLAVETTTDGDNTAVNTTGKGELYVKHVDSIPVTDNAGSLTVDNAGVFVVQENGAALTALQLIDDTVQVLGTDTYTETTSKGITVGAVRRDADTTLVGTTNEFGPLQMDANGRLKVEAFSGETLPVSFTGSTDVATQTTLAALLTSSQLIDDTVYTDDTSTHATGTSKGLLIMAVAAPTDSNIDANDIGAISMTANRRLSVDLGSGSTGPLKLEDVPSATGDYGIPAMAIRQTTPANLSSTDGDYEMLQMSAGRLWVDTSGIISGINDGRKEITSAGTREALAGSTVCKKVIITAETDNTGVVVVGGTTVVAALATRRGTPLFAGDSIELEIDNLADINLDVTVSTEGVTYTYFT